MKHIKLFALLILISMFSFGQRVLIIHDGVSSLTTNLVNKLQLAGFTVTLSSVIEYQWNGTQPALTNFDCVVHLDGGTPYNQMPLAGQQALVNFVQNGGGYIHTAWNSFEMQYYSGNLTTMRNIILTGLYQNGNNNNQLTKSVPTHPVIDGLPNTFFTPFQMEYTTMYVFGTNPAQVLMKDALGHDIIIVRSFGSGKSVYIPTSGTWAGEDFTTDVNIMKLYINAINWASSSTSIATTTNENTLCQDQGLSVSYTAVGVFTSGNDFTAQLSDASGSFASPINIGSVTATTSGTISTIIPVNTLTGTGYRIRVVSSDPVTTGSDNGSDITIKSLPSVICPDNITANAVSGQCGTNVSFNASGVGTISYSPASGSFFPIGSTTVTTTATTDCGSASCSFTVTVIDNERPSITCPAPVTINASPGLCTGTTTLVPPIVTDNCNSFGNALSFDGGYVNVPNASILNPFNEWTLETWVKRANTGVQEGLIEKYIEPGNTYGYLLRILGNNKAMAGFVFGSFAGYFITGTTTILPNTWYHLAATFNRTTGVMKLYVNGVLDAQVTGMAGLPTIPNTASLKLGARGDDAATRLSNGGIMDEIRIWSVERTQAQIQLSMNSELGSQAGLVALYHLNQGIAGGNNTGLTTATDASGNGNSGSLISFALTGPTSNWVNGQGFGLTLINDAPATYPKGNTNVTWTATDGSGNSATCIQAVTVVDNQAPVITCPVTGNTNRNANAGVCTYTAALTEFNATASDNCAVTSLTYTLTGVTTGTGTTLAGVVFNKGITTVTWTASDGVTTNVTCSFTVTVIDNEPPVFGGSNNVNGDVVYLRSSTSVPWGLNGNETAMSAVFGIGGWLDRRFETVNTATLFSATTKLIFMEGGDGTANELKAFILANKVQMEAWVNNGGRLLMNAAPNEGGNIDFGFGGVTLVYPNYTNTGVATVPGHPIFNGPLTPVGTSWFGGYLGHAILTPAGAGMVKLIHNSENNLALLVEAQWGNGIVMFSGMTLPFFQSSIYGAAWSQPTTGNLHKNILSYLGSNGTNQGNINVSASANQCGANISYNIPQATDNCPGVTITQSVGLASGSFFPVGNTINTFVATDAAGNTATYSFSVTVNDNQSPTFNCPANQNVNLNSSCQLIIPDLVSGLTGSDNCGTVTFTQSPLAGAPLVSLHNQTHNVVITASDGNGNTQTCTVILTGKDVTKPTFICPDNQNVNLNGTCQLIVPNLVAELIGNDNCGTVTFTQTPLAGASLASSHNQSHNVVITANDGNGNTETCTVVLTGKDVTKPTFTCPGNQNVNLNVTCQLIVPNLIAELTGNDNCGTVTFTQSPVIGASFASSHNQTQSVVITASDGNGNTQTCTVILTGKDVTKPTFTCPDNQNVNLNGTCQLLVPNLISELTGNDNCGTVTFTQSPIAGAPLASGHNQTHSIVITASDGNGNTQTCAVVLTGKDVTKPIFTCPYDRNVNLNGTCQLIIPNLISGLTGNDNCGIVTFTQSPVAGALFASSHNQTQNVLITASDGNGNTQTCTVVLTAKDVTLPVITCPSPKTISCDASILPANTGSATATDNCGGSPVITYSDVSEQDPNPSHVGYYNYTITRTWMATDVATNTSTCDQTITVQDITKPMITCPANKLNVPFDFGQLYATIVIGTATATDNCAGNANIAIAGTRSDNVVITNQQYPLGQTTVAWSATDPSDNSDGCTQTITVRKRNTAVTYTGDMIDSKICVQYSDIINLQAKLTDNEGLATPNNISGRTITFQLLSGTTVLRSKSATTNASGIAVDTFKIEQAPGLYSVKTIFAGDTYFNGNNDQDNCEVKQEDAILEYNGSQYFTTASATTLVGSITLAAAVNDIDDGSDKRGDIRKAKTTFRDGGPGGTVLGSANLPVGLVNPGILTNGLSATTQNNITLNSNDASSGGKIFQVWVGASDHYKGADAGPTPVTLALPGQDFVTGGGHLVVTNSAGTYAGTVNSKMNFGFTMKWNKSGKNLQGNINIVFRKWQLYNNEWQWRVYQMKSNAINSMAVVEVGSNGQPVSGTNPAAFRKAIINTKANLKDVTDPLNNIDLGGNHNLTLDAWDHITANGGVSDKISVTLMGATTNELLFSSSWVSNATQAQTITGGNINVRNGSSSSSTTINTITRSGQMEIAAKEDGFVVKAYPNPTEHEFTLVVTSSLNEKIEIQLYDAAGRKIQTLSAKANETIRFGEKLKAGVYVAHVMQGNKKESIKLIKQ